MPAVTPTQSASTQMDGLPRVIVVLGPWSSGSTAVTGYLARCGGWTCPPHQLTNDPLTTDSHEPKAFRDALCDFIDELTLKPKQPLGRFVDFFGPWLAAKRQEAAAGGHAAVVLKHPLAAFVLQPILAVCEPHFLVVLRPLPQIETSRLRRRWHAIYGQDGARQIYGAAFSGLIAAGRSFQTVSYPQFLADCSHRLSLLANLGLQTGAAPYASAEAWVRTPELPTPSHSQVN